MDVVLIGPIAAGKSTLGTLLSAALGLPQCSMDDVRFRYYREIGYRAQEIRDSFWPHALVSLNPR